MDSRRAFLTSTKTLIDGFWQLTGFRIIGNNALLCILEVNVVDTDIYAESESEVVRLLKTINPVQYALFELIFQESSIIMSFSWLESFLDEVEEALYLSNPENLGEQVQVKLGKILISNSIEDIVHDIVKRKVRERSQWSLSNRLKDLKEKHNFAYSVTEEDLEWASKLRNDIIHNRRAGTYVIDKKRVTYKNVGQKTVIPSEDVERFLGIVASTIIDLYFCTRKELNITSKFKADKSIGRTLQILRTLWSYRAAPSNNSLQPTMRQSRRLPAEGEETSIGERQAPRQARRG